MRNSSFKWANETGFSEIVIGKSSDCTQALQSKNSLFNLVFNSCVHSTFREACAAQGFPQSVSLFAEIFTEGSQTLYSLTKVCELLLELLFTVRLPTVNLYTMKFQTFYMEKPIQHSQTLYICFQQRTLKARSEQQLSARKNHGQQILSIQKKAAERKTQMKMKKKVSQFKRRSTFFGRSKVF